MDTVFVVDTLVDTLIQHTTDTLLVAQGSSGWQIAGVFATIAMAVGTIILAFFTYLAIRNNSKWNKRIEKRSLEWNKRIVRMRTLPFLGFDGGKYYRNSEPPGCVSSFKLRAKNIGVGPILSQNIRATQGSAQFSAVIEGAGTLLKGLGVNEEEVIVFTKKNPSDKSTGSIKLLVVLLTILGETIKIHYIINKPIEESSLPGLGHLEIEGEVIRLGTVQKCIARI
ncbi:hypothetical protein JXM67_07775 [candidate division WOR-3 bacterium]|nr:hypothetical protein [candidate division WOR-3 bacterium]